MKNHNGVEYTVKIITGDKVDDFTTDDQVFAVQVHNDCKDAGIKVELERNGEKVDLDKVTN